MEKQAAEWVMLLPAIKDVYLVSRYGSEEPVVAESAGRTMVTVMEMGLVSAWRSDSLLAVSDNC